MKSVVKGEMRSKGEWEPKQVFMNFLGNVAV